MLIALNCSLILLAKLELKKGKMLVKEFQLSSVAISTRVHVFWLFASEGLM